VYASIHQFEGDFEIEDGYIDADHEAPFAERVVVLNSLAGPSVDVTVVANCRQPGGTPSSWPWSMGSSPPSTVRTGATASSRSRGR
jgi:hypothetical protein